MANFGKLGKGFPKHDARIAALHDRCAGARLSVVAPECRWDKGVMYGMLANDQYGDCTCAGVYHMMQTWAANASGSKWEPTDQQTLALYTIVGGWPQHDDGAVETDVLNWWATHGVPDQNGVAQLVKYMRIDQTQIEWVKYAIEQFGGAYIGLNLPRSAQNQVQVGQQWQPVTGAPERITAPGSWGGHCVPLVGYDTRGFWCITWGERQYMTNEFFAAYCDEAYAVLSPDWTAPQHLDVDALTADMASLS